MESIKYLDKNRVSTLPRRYAGKNAVVTAGTAGIGKAIAFRLAAEGARVAVCSRKQKNVEALCLEAKAQGLDIVGISCNVTRPGDLERFVQFAATEFKNKIDVVVSNVGVNPAAGEVLSADERVYDKIFDANVKSHWKLLKLCRPLMNRGGAIVLVSSVGGYQPSFPLGLYSASKTALIGLAKALSFELGRDGIRINTLAPGVVRTKMAALLWQDDEARKQREALTDLNRVADPIDMGGIVAFMCSEDASFMTGEVVVASGGTNARL